MIDGVRHVRLTYRYRRPVQPTVALGTIKDTNNLAASAVELNLGVWLDKLHDPGVGLEMLCLKREFVGADFHCRKIFQFHQEKRPSSSLR